MNESRKTYSSESIAVSFDRALCIHAARCVEGLPAVFRPGERPWIQPSNAEAGAIAATVAQDRKSVV